MEYTGPVVPVSSPISGLPPLQPGATFEGVVGMRDAPPMVGSFDSLRQPPDLGPFAPGTAGEYSSRGERRPPWAREHVRQQRRVIDQAIVQPAKEVAAYADLAAGFPYFIAHVTGQGVASGGYALAGEKEPLKKGRELIERAGEASWNRFLSAPFQTMLGAEADETAVGKLGLGVNRYVDEAAKYWSEKTGNPEVGELLKQATGLAMAKGVEVATNFFREGTLRLRGKAESKATDVPAGNAAREKMEGLAAEFKEESTPKEEKPFKKEFPNLAKSKMVDQYGKPFALGGIGLAIYSSMDDKEKGLAAALPFALAMRQAEPHIPAALHRGFERAKLGDEGSLHHLDMLRMELPQEQRALLDPAIHALEEVHFKHEGVTITAPIAPIPQDKKDPLFGVIPLAIMLKMPEGTPMGTLHKGLRYTTGALAALARELPNRFELTKAQIEGVLGRQGVTQVEKDLIRGVVGERETISAKDLVTGVRAATGDFELKPRDTDTFANYGVDRIGREADSPFEVTDYRTTIYQSPLELGTANHFSDPNYFAHTRSFDEGGVRHVVEIQSDVAQKVGKELSAEEIASLEAEGQKLTATIEELRNLCIRDAFNTPRSRKASQTVRELEVRRAEIVTKARSALEAQQVAPVRPILKDWWKRIIREEVAQGSQGGVMRFATADTVAKVEGWPNLDEFAWRGAAEQGMEGPQGPRFSPEHQSIYDRYRREIEKFLKSEYKARPYTDPHGHTWLEIDLPSAEKPISMFGQGGKVDPHLLKIMGGVALAVGAGVVEKQLDPEHDLLRAIETGAGAALVGRLLPRYVEYVKSDFKGAANDTLGVLGKSVLVGALQHDPIAGVATALGLGLWNSQKKIAKSPIVKTTEDLANLFQGGSLRRERQAATFEVGIKSLVPDAGRRDAIFRALDKGDISSLPRDEQVAAKAWLKTSRDLWDEAEKLGLTKGRKFIESYVAHLVEKAGGSPKTAQEIVAGLERSGGAEAGKWSPHLQRRFYKTLEDLQAALVGKGLRIKTTDLAEMGSSYIRSMGRAIESERMIQGVKAVKTPKGLGSLLRPESGKGQAPADWPSINSPYMRGLRAHPEVAPHLRWFLEARNSSDAANAFFALNDAIKRVGVSYSLFHAFNLGVAHIGARHGSGISGQANIFAGLSDVAKGWAKQAGIPVDSPLHKAFEVYYSGGVGDSLDRGLMAGLRVQPMAEVGVGVGERLAGSIHPILGKAAEIGGKGQAWFDRQTWEFAHPASKIQLFLSEYNYELAKRAKKLGGEERIPEAMKDEVAQTVASYVNEVYGHIDWYRVASEANTKMGQWAAQAITPSAQPWLRVAMFAPDWTISTFRAMWGAFPSAEKPIGSLSWRLHAGYALRTGLMLMTLQNGLNLALSGHNIWDPQQKDPFQVDMGDGRRIQIFKHATEFFEWAQHPVQTLANKSAYPWREVTSQVAKQDYPGGPPMSGLERVGPTAEQRLGHAVKGLLPFPVQPFFDPALTPAEAGTKALLGLGSINIHGMSEEEKARLREKRARLLQKRKEQ